MSLLSTRPPRVSLAVAVVSAPLLALALSVSPAQAASPADGPVAPAAAPADRYDGEVADSTGDIVVTGGTSADVVTSGSGTEETAVSWVAITRPAVGQPVAEPAAEPAVEPAAVLPVAEPAAVETSAEPVAVPVTAPAALPVAELPATAMPVTASPVTASPVTASPVTAVPVTASPVTAAADISALAAATAAYREQDGSQVFVQAAPLPSHLPAAQLSASQLSASPLMSVRDSGSLSILDAGLVLAALLFMVTGRARRLSR